MNNSSDILFLSPKYDRLEIPRAKTIGKLKEAEPKVIWRKHEAGPMGSHIWAPELHYIDGNSISILRQAAAIKRNDKIFMTYSASCTDPNYAVGLLTADT